MNNSEKTAKDTNQTDHEYQEWLSDCKGLATDAGFRGLLEAYFAGHPSEDCADLAIGAQEILSHVVDGLLEENQDEDACAECRLDDLIYPPVKEETKEETKDEQPAGSCSFGVPNILQ